MKKSLFALALGTFALGIAEFIMEGILVDIANSLHVSIPQAGHLISVYALGVCLGSFSLIVMHKYRPKNILLFLVSLMTIGAIGASLAPTYPTLLLARLAQGLPHGAYFGVGCIIAVKLAREGKGASAVSLMCAGMTVANLAGVPFGTMLSHQFSWRMPFYVSILLGGLTLILIRCWVPNVEALPNNGMKAQFRFLRNKAPWLILLATFFGNGGVLCWFSYISPLLQHNGGFDASVISALMAFAGMGMVIGNLLSGQLCDRYKPGLIAGTIQMVSAVALLLVFALSNVGWVSVALMFIICGCLFGVSSPQQFLILKHSEGGEMLGGCCIQSAFNLGNAAGAFFGGIPVSLGMGFNWPALVGVPLAVAGAACLFAFHKKYE